MKNSHKTEAQNNFTHWFCHYFQKDGSIHLTFHLHWIHAAAENPAHLHALIKLENAQNE